jgi:hypothetical protein
MPKMPTPKSKLDETSQMMRAMARSIDDTLNTGAGPKKAGFVLLVMPFDGPPGARTNYISNAEREDVVAMLKEVVARFEVQAEVTGHG